MILLGDAAVVLKDFENDCIDLTVTSPPYDSMRTYGGHSFDFKSIAMELYRVTKEAGIVVWIVGDSSVDGDESGSSFRQALTFKEIGFKLFDTMIYSKKGFSTPSPNKYHQTFEYMFVLSKGLPKTFNPLIDRLNKHAYQNNRGSSFREPDGTISTRRVRNYRLYGKRYNIWLYDNAYMQGTKDEMVYKHPATMPEALAEDHIKSWSNEGDLILDPFAGSGTTLKAAHLLRRKWIGIEINPDYVSLIKKRLTPYVQQQRLDDYTNKLIINK